MKTNWKPRVEAKKGLEWRQEAYRGDKNQGLERRHSGGLERRRQRVREETQWRLREET